MDKTKIIDLKRKIFLRSALIPIDGLQEVFELNENFSGDELLGELFKKSLRAWEYHHPLIWESKVYKDQLCSCEVIGEGYCKIQSNFDLYLKCLISEDQIILVPNVTQKVRSIGSYPYPGSYFTNIIDYQRPYINLGDLVDDQFYMRGICSRPIIINFNPDKTFSNDSAIYWMNIEEGVLGQKFIDQCLVDILEYVKNLKGNLMLPNMSVDIFNSCENYWMNLKQELDQYYLQSSWRGDLLI